MIPNSTLSSMYARLIGERTLLALAQSNLMANLSRVTNVRTHTFLTNNAQNEFGVSRNYGDVRCYTWDDTTIDCSYAPSLSEEHNVRGLCNTIAQGAKYEAFKDSVEERSGGLITVEPFYSIQNGEDNMRYDIRRGHNKIVDFDIVRVGVKLTAKDDETFKQGLEHIRRAEDPFYTNKPILAHRASAGLVQA